MSEAMSVQINTEASPLPPPRERVTKEATDSELVVKRVNDTRWCVRADATMALSKDYSSFQKVLQVIAGDGTQKL
ncbi:hypothetical protein TNCT_211211 [Trichonephila clavata]|uniref:Uncharacterized protein n=1 Tax=Trichonephila clavata TaxID=2740835 RepID=A0A8X6J390_TRICU|nr:hypothetical protein TNCT_211211 [Trichonephila clavata]